MSFLQKVILEFKEVEKYLRSDTRVVVVALFVIFILPAGTVQVEKQASIQGVTIIQTDSSTLLQDAMPVARFQSADAEIQGKETIAMVPTQNTVVQEPISDDELQVVAELTEEDIEGFNPALPFGYRIAREVVSEVSGYNPVPEQTDSTPCITASGKDICNHEVDVVAANWLKFGTKIRIPEYFGDRIFTVEDRMNKRYPNNTDVLFYDKQEAREFGRRTLVIQILEEVDVELARK